jgi:hypothetical protein
MKTDKSYSIGSMIFIAIVICLPVTHAQNLGFLKEKTNQNGISYITGGIGSEEREELNRLSKNYSLKLSLSVAGGAYLGTVEVIIADSQGNIILKENSAGPWFLVKLQEGSYTVRAIANKVQKKKDVSISINRLRVINFQWPRGE